MKQTIRNLIPFFGFAALALWLGLSKWWGFFLIFFWIGAAISIGNFISDKNKTGIGRKVTILAIMPIFIVFLGIFQRENLQLEETVFYFAYFLSAGIFTRVLIHYAIAKVFGPLLFGRSFCGWACWTAAILEWLPIKENKKIPAKFTYIRIPVFILSLLIPFLLIQWGYDYYQNHIYGDPKAVIQPFKYGQLVLFLIGNGFYYIAAIALAFIFKKKRAFCKIACPVSLVMKGPAKLSLIKITPSGKTCISCGKCNDACPMDVNVMEAIQNQHRLQSTECIFCKQCANVCPVGAIR